jgi:hypothetical protein
MVLPVLALLIFGSIEMGTAWVTRTKVVSAVTQAARVGASDGSRVEADRDVLLALRAALPADALASADRVVVFRATDPDGAVPSGCVKPVGSSSEVGTSVCNTYTGTTLRSVQPGSMAGFGGVATKKDVYWPPAGRNDALSDPPDYLGVWIRTRNHPLTHLGLGNLTITATSVVRIQPDLNG